MPDLGRGSRVPSSPLELLLPKGFAQGLLTVGNASPIVLAPWSEAPAGDAVVDLVVLAPTKDERRNPAWIRDATTAVAARLSQGGIAYVVPARAMRLRQALESRGLRSSATLLHIPDIPRSRHIVPLGTEAERYALSGKLQMRAAKRIAASAAARSAWASTLAPTGAVLRRDPAAPLAAWLFELEPAPATPGSVLLTARREPSGGVVLHRFPAGEGEPDCVAKVSARSANELHALLEVTPDAARAGARVPDVLWSGALGAAQLIVQTALAGISARRLVERGELDAGDLQERVAGWLERWGRTTARPRTLDHDDLDRSLLAPARRLAGSNGPYLAYLDALCARAAGSSCPVVATHGDLTAANVLVDRTGGIGILDWEEASAAGLPLTDFFYAAADAVAAADRYADRSEAVRACFAADGARVSFIRRLVGNLADALSVDAAVQEVCFHACWLHHAGNEADREAADGSGPFAAILRAVAAEPSSFSPTNGL
jgi:hypothetical protein